MLLAFLVLLPRNLLSRVAGVIARISLPGPLRVLQLRSFGRTFGVNFDEVKDELASFKNVQEFFTRELVAGCRPVDDAADAFVSPCDGAWGATGPVENGMVLQVKGRPYSLSRLLGGADAAPYEGGVCSTLYLSPKDYHRYHTPCALSFVRAEYVPGTLWPVNSVGLLGVDGLFAENERIVCAAAVPGHEDKPPLILIPVGATMVGKVHLTFSSLTTNVSPKGDRVETYDPPKALGKGDEFGRFEFGSTIIVVAPPGMLELTPQPEGTPLKLGTRIGTVLGGAPAS